MNCFNKSDLVLIGDNLHHNHVIHARRDRLESYGMEKLDVCSVFGVQLQYTCMHLIFLNFTYIGQIYL